MKPPTRIVQVTLELLEHGVGGRLRCAARSRVVAGSAIEAASKAETRLNDGATDGFAYVATDVELLAEADEE